MPVTKHRVNLPERYRVIGHIASGGMASVWEAEDVVLGRTVAVKVLSAGFAAETSASRRFQREARAAARVSVHPHVVTIYDIGEHDGHPFIVMEHLPGGTVAERLKSRKPIPRDVALRWLSEAGRALDTAHAAGIVHRDVKPANLLLDADDRLAVGDFGIATLAAEATLTMTGDVIGTAAYLSPEQALGKPATPASDRYALAVVAYELLTGRRPFVAESAAAQMLQHVETQPPAPSTLGAGVPPAVDAVLWRGLAKDPSDRPRSARELVADLTAAVGGDSNDGATRILSTALTMPVRAIKAIPPAVTAQVRAVSSVGAARAADPVPSSNGKRPRTASHRASIRRGRRTPRLAMAVVAVVLGALVAAFALGADRNPSGGSTTTTTGKTPQTRKAPPKTPNQLNTAGYRKLLDGDFEGALPLLQRSVEGFRAANATDSVEYMYALFNLAQALRQTGHPAEAIPILEERMTYDNQRKVVREALKLARAEAGLSKKGHGSGQHGDEG
jgi:eukaryotic-like serine/threonine-protein kinase